MSTSSKVEVVAEHGGLQSTDRLLAPAVAETLSNLELAPEDLALSRLAERYARELDGAAAAEAAADRVLRRVEDPELAEQVAALRAKLSARSAVETIGPKLQAALTELGATPKYRAQHAKGGAPSGSSRLAAIRNKAG